MGCEVCDGNCKARIELSKVGVLPDFPPDFSKGTFDSFLKNRVHLKASLFCGALSKCPDSRMFLNLLNQSAQNDQAPSQD